MSTTSFQQDSSISQAFRQNLQPTVGDLIFQLKQTDEHNRSKAIADSITFLLSYIKSLETKNSSLQEKITELTTSNADLNMNLTKLKSDNTLLQNEIKILKSKFSITDQLNHTLEQTISELNTKLSNQQINFDSKCDKFSNILTEYKSVFEALKQEKASQDNELNNVIDELNQLKTENEHLSSDNNTLKKEKMKYHSLQKKVKEYELLLYKIDLENQTFRQELKKYQKSNVTRGKSNITYNQQTDSIDAINKIDLNNELNTIDNNYKGNLYGNVMKVVDTENNDIHEANELYGKDVKIDNMNKTIYDDDYSNIAALTKEIKMTENILKEYSALLLQKENSTDARTNSNDFKEIMTVMEIQTEKLINLKKKYNQLIKTSIV